MERERKSCARNSMKKVMSSNKIVSWVCFRLIYLQRLESQKVALLSSDKLSEDVRADGI